MRMLSRMALSVAGLVLCLLTIASFAQQATTNAPQPKATTPRASGTAKKKPAATKPAAPAPETPEMILARNKQACAAGDFKVCLHLHELVKTQPELIASSATTPDSVPIQAANPELAVGTTWTYRVLSLESTLDNKLLEITLSQRDATNASFQLRLDGKEESLKLPREGAKYFSPRAGKMGKIALVAQSVLPDSCSKNAHWSASGTRRGIIEGGRIVGWVEEGPRRSASGPVLHNAPGGVVPAAEFWEDSTKMILSPTSAFAAQVLTATPEGARVLFNLVSVKSPGGNEQTATPALESAAWNKLGLWLKENTLGGDFERTTLYALVAHANQHPDLQFVMVGGSKLAKSGEGVCLVWGHKGVVASLCDAQALNVEPLRSVSYVVP